MNQELDPPTQLSFAKLASGAKADWPPERRRRLLRPVPDAPVLAEFRHSLICEGRTEGTANGRVKTVQSLLAAASRIRKHAVRLKELFLDPDLLAEVACEDIPLARLADELLKVPTLRQRRGASRAFIRHMYRYLGVDPIDLIRRFHNAITARCRHVGLTNRLDAGRRSDPETYTPSDQEIEDLVRAAAQSNDAFLGERNEAFIRFLQATGLRVSSVIGIDGAHFYRLSSGLCVTVREKCKDEPVQVRVTPEIEALLHRYVEAYNHSTLSADSPRDIGIGSPGPFWRARGGTAWATQAASVMIRKFSRKACSRPFGPHAIRHSASEFLTERAPRETVADVFRWGETRTLDEHYAPPPGRLGPPGPIHCVPEEGGDHHDAQGTQETGKARQDSQLAAG